MLLPFRTGKSYLSKRQFYQSENTEALNFSYHGSSGDNALKKIEGDKRPYEQKAIRRGHLVSTVVLFPASKQCRLLETAYQLFSLMAQDPHRKIFLLGLFTARAHRWRLSLLTCTGWIYIRSSSRSESDVCYSGKSIENAFTIALFHFFKKHNCLFKKFTIIFMPELRPQTNQCPTILQSEVSSPLTDASNHLIFGNSVIIIFLKYPNREHDLKIPRFRLVPLL